MAPKGWVNAPATTAVQRSIGDPIRCVRAVAAIAADTSGSMRVCRATTPSRTVRQAHAAPGSSPARTRRKRIVPA